MKESDMYQPIKDLFESLGFLVKAEVGHVDVMCQRADDFVLIEMKKNINIKLLTQGVKRQRLCEHVYIAVIKPMINRQNMRFMNDKYLLLKRLNLGLIYVDGMSASIVFDPMDFDVVKSQHRMKKKSLALKKEFHDRMENGNIGGVSKTKIMTAYREKSLFIAACLQNQKMLSIKELKALGSDELKTASILQKNFYGWFIRVDRGVYSLTDKGKEALIMYRFTPHHQ